MRTRPPTFRRLLPVVVVLLSAVALADGPGPRTRPTAAEARAFVARVNGELDVLDRRMNTVSWIQETYVNEDTDRLLAQTTEERMTYLEKTAREAERFRGLQLDPDTARSLKLLRLATPLPAPADAAKRKELAELTTKLSSEFARGSYCGKDGKGPCRDLQTLSGVLAKSRNYDELLDAWSGWHSTARPLAPLYARYVELANQGARDAGFADLGEVWRANYDMTPAELEAETDRLWGQVQPLYKELHCYVRGRLAQRYPGRVPATGPIPAHLLGDMWAQTWSNVYPLVRPFPEGRASDVDGALRRRRFDDVKMVKLAEAFFVSLGFDPLPDTFWTRSLLRKPADRSVECHASAWDMDGGEDVRIKMCIQVNEEDLRTLHHELGHVYYSRSYKGLPNLFRRGAHDGFHEAIGDAVLLSVTPDYLRKVGLATAGRRDQRSTIDWQMKSALDEVAFLPWGRLVDQWRWDVFSGKVRPADYEKAWWALREKYQGVSRPLADAPGDFDPGAKYHVATNVPYLPYFFAEVLKFQFYRGMCRAAGHTGPLHECSVFANAAAGAKLEAMLALGGSKPWPDALEALTGERQMDASALLEYYAPLQAWLHEQNKGRTCGW